MKNNFQAIKAAPSGSPALYPTVPAIWPNRAIRRALRFARALPTEWDMFFDRRPDLRTLAKAVR